jgi:hypothetical protein
MNHIIKTPSLAVLMGLIITLSGHAQSFLTNGLVAYYPFSGNANDASGNGNNGVVSGATLAVDRFGQTNCCYFFDGVSSRILASIPNLPTTNQDRSLVLWAKYSGVGNAEVTYVPAAWGSNASGKAFGIMAQGASPGWYGQCYGSGQDVSSGVSVDTNWHQIAFVLQTNTANVFCDGVLKASLPKSLNTGFSQFCIGTGVEYFIGRNTYFPGWIDDVRVYNRAVSTNEIQLLYQYESGSSQFTGAVLALQLNTTNLVVGGSYQIQTSTNLINWFNYGIPFIAISTNAPQYVNMTSSQGYFRLLAAP